MSTDSPSSSSSVPALTHYSPLTEVAEDDDKPHPHPLSPPPQPQTSSPSFSPSAPPYAQAPTNILAEHSHPSRSARAVPQHPSCSGAKAPDTTDTSAEATLERKYQNDLTAAAKTANAVMTRRPTFLQAASKKLFPNAKQPVDLYHTYVNTYREDAVATSGDQGGSITLKRTLTSFKTVADLLLKAIQTGQAPSLPTGQDGANYSGVYTRKDAVDVGAQMKGADLERFLQGLNQLAQDPAGALQHSTADYFEKPSTTTLVAGTGVSPKNALSLSRFTQFRTEAELRAADGTLSPKSKQLIDAMRLPPPYPDPRTLPATPMVYSVSVTTASTAPSGVPLPGAFLVTDRGSLSKNTAGVFYSPELGLHEFDSLPDFRAGFVKQGGRDALLNTLSDRNRALLTCVDGFSVGIRELNEDIFTYSAQSQLDRQKDDVAYRVEQAKQGGITRLDELGVIERHSAEPLQASFDVDKAQRRRLAAWVEHHRPAWWKNATEGQRAQLDQLERDAHRKAEVLHGLMKDNVPSPHEYAVWQIKRTLQAKYPDANIDPDTILVHSDAIHGTRVPNTCVSLTQFVMDNVKSKVDLIANAAINPHWRASFMDRHGKEITLLQPELRALARNLNVGQGHQDLLNARMLSAGGHDLRQAWKDSYMAKMRADAEEARLSGALDETSYNQVKTLLDQPDAKHRLQIGYLKIGGSEGDNLRPDNYRNGASVIGPLLIAARDANKNDPVTLYAPNAPDGDAFQRYSSMKALNADRRFRRDEWKEHFKSHVSENMKEYLDQQFARGYSIFNRARVSGASLHETQDTLYDAYVRKMVASTQTLSKSNHQLNKETAVDVFLLAADVATTAASLAMPARAAIKSLARLLDPEKAIASLARLPNFATIAQRGVRRPGTPFAEAIPNRATESSLLQDAAAAHRMMVVEFQGKRYLAPKVPDQLDGHYLLRMIHPQNNSEIVSSTIVAKPQIENGVEVWRRMGIKGGSPPGLEWNADWDAAVSQYLGVPSAPTASNSLPPGPTPQQILARSAISNINDPVEVRNKIALLGNDASEWVAKHRQPPQNQRRPVPQLPPSATGADIMDGVYDSSNGMVVGELHNTYAGKQLIMDNINKLKDKRAGTLYVEGIPQEEYGADLDIFNNTGRMPPALDQKLTRMSSYPTLDPNGPYSTKRLFESAHRNGMKIVPLDNFASFTGSDIALLNEQLAHASDEDFSFYRQMLFSYIASNVIRYNQSINGNTPWVALMGYAHINGLPPNSPAIPGFASGVPGIAPLTDTISVVALPTGQQVDPLFGDIHLNIQPPP